MSFDDTARHPLAEPMLDGFVQAGGIKLLRAELPAAARPPAPASVEVDDMAQTTELGTAESLADTRPPAPKPARARAHGHGKTRARPRYRPSGRINLELTPDPVAPAVFGEGVLTTRRRPTLPWPVVIGALLAAALLILLITR
jgi:hypothetical protein